MWSSSSSYIGSSESGSITNIAQYIEDYIDLVENIPNEIARHVSRLHEYNNRYYQLLDKLERTWESLANSQMFLSNGEQVNVGGNTSTPGKLNFISSSSTGTTASDENYNLHERGTISDKNSGNVSDKYDKLSDSKKGLRAVFGLQKCLIEIQEISDEKLFIVQSILDQLDCKARQLDYDHRSVTIGNLANNLNNSSSKGISSLIGASSDPTNHISDSNGVSNNVNSSGSGKGEITSTKESNVNSNGTSLSATVNNCASNSLSNKRSSSRRNLNSKQDISEITASYKRGVKRGGVKVNTKDLKRNKSSKEVLNNSPPALYEDTPIDPDEPTYCSCEQISYGEMICCDNSHCPIEWFHFACVALTTKPKGKWYCPNCRGDRSNIPKK